MGNLIARIVEASRRHAVLVTLVLVLLSLAGAWYTAGHISMDTDVDKLISADLPWRQREAALDRAFPQNSDLMVVVVDGATADLATDAARTLGTKLAAQGDLFHLVREPEGGPFFRREGLLFLPVDDVQNLSDQLIAAQPLIGTLSADPSLRGVLDALDLLAQGALHGDIEASAIATPLSEVAAATEAALAGHYAPLSWQKLLSGRTPEPRELRRFILTQPVLDFGALQPGKRAADAVRAAAAEAGLTPDRGVEVRITGPVALSDDQLSALTQDAGFSTTLSIGLLCLWLFLALRAPRLVGAIIVTLVVGLVACATFAVTAVGALNPISAAFAVLFVGLAIDFGIQFSVRYRDERFHVGDPTEALRLTALGIGRPLAVAAAATAVGFFSFVPTDYVGVSELGLIAGFGMLVALALNLTLLPALLTLLRPRGEAHAVGFTILAPADAFLVRRRGLVMAFALVLALGSLALLPSLRFDFNPLNLQSQNTEAMRTILDLMKDETNTPNTIEVLTPSADAAAALAKKLDAVPEVAQTVTVETFVPADQDKKIEILADAASLLGPTLSPPAVKPAPTDAENLAAITATAKDMTALAAKGDPAAAKLAQTLQAAASRGAAILPLLTADLAGGVAARLDDLRQSLAAAPVTLQTLPPEIKDDWITSDGKARVEVFPKGGARSNEELRNFVAAVRAVAPDATGTPVTIQESADTVSHAFLVAGIIAVTAIALLLLVVLRRLVDVALVLAPLALAGLMTLAAGVLLGMPLNYANIIALPLLLGIGVAFDIYFVMRWRAGAGDLLQSSTARAILFSALTTGTAFGSLALTSHPGTAEMGKLLSLSLACTLFCTFVILPALLGPAPRENT